MTENKKMREYSDCQKLKCTCRFVYWNL